MTSDKIELRQKFKEVSTDDPKEMTDEDFEIIWAKECMLFYGQILTGEKRHYCPEWDFMPIDETCEFEFEACTCYLEKKNG
jgi:hypothetical protein